MNELSPEDILYLFYTFIMKSSGVVEKKRLEGFYKYLYKLGFRLCKAETFFRRVRELASFGYFVRYVDRRRGIYYITDSVINLVKPQRQKLLEKWYLERRRRYRSRSRGKK